ncbi:hypothetical protein JOC78_002036 [Bacillus ectoiniformans]|uniref:hypothetical protein n=1 Tax=Bacillus ectoiniformans TaxID=1494429 RepID=UPI00195F1D42|nr:hypothetical protein [Bacillus ectoiniformans]MBM7649083.1 hypothetical protein [Bacillus ectoiniformans]
MGKRNKSKRFVQQGKNAVAKHDERFPYHMTYSEAEAGKFTSSNTEENPDMTLGGF